jgi:hypothetical protein
MTGGAASDTAIYRARWIHNRIGFPALLTTAQNSANVEMGRCLVTEKEVTWHVMSQQISIRGSYNLPEIRGRGRIFTNSISGNRGLTPLQYTDLNGYVFWGL